MNSLPIDHEQRRQALDINRSFIVQAPAGSGKTELLTQRILALLAVSATPEEILAITFTRKAAAEMHKRLFEALEGACSEDPPVENHAVCTWTLARAALVRDRECGWNLLDCPARLQVMTIDGFCAALIRRLPWLARFGEIPGIAEDPVDLYRIAAERLLARLEHGREGAKAIERLLAHLDNRVPLLRDLLMMMLGRRDQWLRHLDVSNPAATRPDLEKALRQEIVLTLERLRSHLDADLLQELCLLGAWAAGNLAAAADDNPLAALAGRLLPPAATVDDLPVWLAIAGLLLTKDDEIRKSFSRAIGFPADKDPVAKGMKDRISTVCDRLRDDPALVQSLRELRHLPATAYGDDQWDVLAALIDLLPLAVRELRETFKVKGEVDFAEVSMGALVALGDDLAPADLLLHLDSRLRHILVDEFQDTSRGQYELLSRLTAGWERGDGRTLFVVGDPMQSIYRFREAEVGLYLRIRSSGLENVRLTPLLLRANFRSQAGLVDWFNATFASLFPGAEDETRGAVPYSAAVSVQPDNPGPATTMTWFAERDDVAEAARVIALIRQAQAADCGQTVAVLARSRNHLAALVEALKTAGISWQAQEIAPLSSRPVIRDLVALTRAVLHPADRVAWLAVLRAPWCGLRLDDLLALCGQDAELTLWECLTGVLEQQLLFPSVSADGLSRLEPVARTLARALANKGRIPLRRLIESTWLELNGPAGLASADLADTGQFFALLEELEEGGDLIRIEALEERLDKLFAAPDPLASPSLQLMTIHKAKGLEFDTVILPGLGKTVRGPDRSLLVWQEQVDTSTPGEGLLLAPIPASTSDDPDRTYQAIARIHAEKDRLETLRLFYVAATRARRQLHLLGHARRKQNGDLTPASGSFLHVAWPVFSSVVEREAVGKVDAVAGTETTALMLRRLPAGWVAPSMASALSIAAPGSRRASETRHQAASGLRLSLQTEEGRVVGTVVHEMLERIAREGPDQWPEARLANESGRWRHALITNGIPMSRVDACLASILTALENTLRSPRGRWVLGEHREAACEWALTGMIDDQPVHAVIDRTFIDQDGVRWVVDYKTSAPEGDEPLAAFIERESRRYQTQLADYRKLLSLQYPRREVRAALYFPMVDTWNVVD